MNIGQNNLLVLIPWNNLKLDQRQFKMSEANDLYLGDCNDDLWSDSYHSEKCTGERWEKFIADLVFYGIIAVIVSLVLSVLLYVFCICQYKW